MASLSRRQLLRTAFGIKQTPLSVVAPIIRPREEWAIDRPPRGALEDEDVRFLIVHHSASHNGHTGADVPRILRGFYDFHTSQRGWNDIAYNFLVDAEGGIWEGRAGSLEGPVAGDATGGNQGFTQLACVIGDYRAAQPTQATLTSLVSLMAWLAERYEISTKAGSEVTFVSRGSSLHPAGTEVTTPSITGHRAMSRTTCPGDQLNGYVAEGLMADVEAVRVAAEPTTTTRAPSTTTTHQSTTSTAVDTTDVAGSTPSTTIPVAAVPTPLDAVGIIATTGAVVVLGIGAALWRYRRMRRD